MMLAMADRVVADLPAASPVLELAHPIAGFPEARDFELVPVEEGSVLAHFRAVDNPAAQFLVVPAPVLFPAYAPEIDDESAAVLGLDADTEVLVLLIVHAAETLVETTVNLRAPLLVNVDSRRAAQVILDDVSLPLAAPLPR